MPKKRKKANTLSKQEPMGLNDIQLSPATLTSLYRSSLVEKENTDQPPAPPEKAGAVSWKYLGSNKKNILVAVYTEAATYLPDDELSFLTNILTACQLDLGDIALINMRHDPRLSGTAALDHFSSKTVLLFGIDPAGFGLPVDFPFFQVQPFARSVFLYAPPIAACRQDQLLKSKLWVCLRRIFEL